MIGYALIQAYMKAKNYTQDKQAAIDLGISKQMVSAIKSGDRFLSDETATYIAERCGFDAEETLIKLHAEKETDERVKTIWINMLKKYKHGMNTTISIIISGLLASMPSVHDFALCILC